jgi:hypothetical protein
MSDVDRNETEIYIYIFQPNDGKIMFPCYYFNVVQQLFCVDYKNHYSDFLNNPNTPVYNTFDIFPQPKNIILLIHRVSIM